MGTLIFLFLSAFAALAQGHQAEQLLTPELRLRKLSLHLRGKVPTRQEYEAAKKAHAAPVAAENAFYEGKIREYIASAEYAGKMTTRLDELFRVRTTVDLPEFAEEYFKDRAYSENFGSYADTNSQDRQAVRNSLDALFRSIVRENLSWDQLLLAKKYTVYSPMRGTRNTDLGFYNEIAPSLPPSSDGVLKKTLTRNEEFQIQGTREVPPQSLSFDERDPRIAGALTTSRFSSRYNTTNLNQNRKRAAAVFRIFLCDDMKPVIVPTPSEDQELLNLAMSDLDEAVAGEPKIKHPKVMLEKHGADPVCMSCHFKLDPAGKTFLGISSVMSSEPAPGALSFKRSDGTLVNIKVGGIGELGKAITEQNEYAQCQVRHFWRWFIGKDVPLSPARLDELTRAFNGVDRKTNDFVAHIVNQPEFYSKTIVKEKSNDATGLWFKASNILRACTSCHGGQMADLSKFPIGGSKKTHKGWVAAIADALDMKNNGKNRFMPPKSATWSNADVQEAMDGLRAWICAGSPDESGEATLDRNDLPEGVCGK